MSKLRYSAPVRRGFLPILRFIQEDCQAHIFDPAHPIRRRLKQPAKGDVEAALRWLFQEANEQHAREASKLAAEASAAEASPPIAPTE